eukprot:scaffold1824_cov332-Prasinococcus_capsulatus_cf.AAC.4
MSYKGPRSKRRSLKRTPAGPLDVGPRRHVLTLLSCVPLFAVDGLHSQVVARLLRVNKYLEAPPHVRLLRGQARGHRPAATPTCCRSGSRLVVLRHGGGARERGRPRASNRCTLQSTAERRTATGRAHFARASARAAVSIAERAAAPYVLPEAEARAAQQHAAAPDGPGPAKPSHDKRKRGAAREEATLDGPARLAEDQARALRIQHMHGRPLTHSTHSLVRACFRSRAGRPLAGGCHASEGQANIYGDPFTRTGSSQPRSALGRPRHGPLPGRAAGTSPNPARLTGPRPPQPPALQDARRPCSRALSPHAPHARGVDARAQVARRGRDARRRRVQSSRRAGSPQRKRQARGPTRCASHFSMCSRSSFPSMSQCSLLEPSCRALRCGA